MNRNQYDAQMVGILLAAGAGTRFDPSGAQNKLMQPLPQGDTLAVAAAKNLLAVLPVLAVVRPGADALAAQLRALHCEVLTCGTAAEGMGASLVAALTHTRDAAGWVVALADMPYVQPATITALANTVRQGASIAAPTYQGRRGNPVAFGRLSLPALLSLSGDEGARRLLKRFPVTEVTVDDAGVVTDIDTVADLSNRCG